MGKLGLTDVEQIEAATREQAVTFTRDVDFLRVAVHRQHIGVIYVHQQKLSVGECIRRMKTISETRSLEDMRDRIIFLCAKTQIAIPL